MFCGLGRVNYQFIVFTFTQLVIHVHKLLCLCVLSASRTSRHEGRLTADASDCCYQLLRGRGQSSGVSWGKPLADCTGGKTVHFERRTGEIMVCLSLW
jgi:hypothetical protein